jgi:NDP-sugar pyrophosphorylase family protein
MVLIVYMVAGMSSRFGGIKQLCNVGVDGETLIEVSVKQALKQPFSKLVFITNIKTEQLFKDIFKEEYQNTPVLYIQQKYEESRERPWGTTDAVCSLSGYVDDPFILVNSDDIYGELAFKEGYEKLTTSIKNYLGTTQLRNTIKGDSLVNRGIIEVENESNKVVSLRETLGINPSIDKYLLDKLCNVNFICFQPLVIELLKQQLDIFKKKHKNDKKIEALLPDDLNTLVQNNTLEFETFIIKTPIVSLTYQSDIETMKKYLSINILD